MTRIPKHKKLLFFYLFSSFLLLSILFFFHSCEKFSAPKVLKVVTYNLSDGQISETSAIAEGAIVDIGENKIDQHGHCWSQTSNPNANLTTITKLGTKKAPGTFQSNVTNLTPLTEYYIRAYVKSGSETKYGEVVSFTTKGTVLPIVTTNSVTNVTDNSATCGGNISSDGGATVTARGVCWSTSQNPTISDSHTTDGTGTGSYISSLTGLLSSTTYYVKAYTTNSVGISYGSQVSFTTKGPATIPSVTTRSVSNITDNSATCGGNVTSDGGATVTARGVCWSTGSNPTLSDSYTVDGSGTGSFTSSLTGLSSNTTYYVRAYATNSEGTAYGNQINFTAGQSITTPVVTTSSVSNITENSATCGGNVTSDGGATVTARGVCWSTSQNPTISNSRTPDGSGTGSFTSNLTSLASNTTYYVRAYATNSQGTAYGNQVSFATLQSITIPTVTTSSVSNITDNSASCGGSVTSDGGATVTARGVCWSTSQNPTISNSHTTDGSGTGSFTSSLTSLSTNTTYYIRAYATNSQGTGYGNQVSFTTGQSITTPVVTTSAISNITENSATSGGNVTSDGGASVTARGVCWSTSQNPTTVDSHTSDGTGTGTFTSSLIGLSSNTTYYVRAYATNSQGPSYGNQVSFTTLASLPTVTTSSVTDITENSASSGGNVTSDGGATVTAYGVCWSTSQNPTLSDLYTTDGSGTGNYSSSITGLSCETTYYVRAYATNSAGTAYGSQVSFTTSQCPANPPTVTTSSVSNIGQTSATCGGNVTSDGGATVTARGVCWSISSNPTTSDSHTTDGSGTGSYSSSITGLSCETTYYVRAYATNSASTAYGSQVSFTTSQCPANPPTVSTSSVSNIGQTSATCGGNVTSDGGTSLTAKGVCWSTSQNPTYENCIDKTNDGTSTGTFTSSITGLSCNTTYYVRAYAINSVGTAYGSQVSFKTSPCLPEVTTSSISNITSNSATSGGNVTSDGGANVTVRGVCWSTSQNPTDANSHTNDGSGTGSFTSSLVGLSGNTTYYVRAYASNSAGTAYGNELSFTTSAPCPSFEVTHTAGNVAPVSKTVNYGTVENNLSGENKCWITQNLGADTQASSATDATETAAGWYWQFNRKQGYKHDGSTRTPSTTWISSIDEASNWTATNDPCTILLGTGWRIPTQTEWSNANSNGGWGGYESTYASVLKLHAAGGLAYTDGLLGVRGVYGYYWSGMQYSGTNGWFLGFFIYSSDFSYYSKASGFSVRCLRD